MIEYLTFDRKPKCFTYDSIYRDIKNGMIVQDTTY